MKRKLFCYYCQGLFSKNYIYQKLLLYDYDRYYDKNDLVTFYFVVFQYLVNKVYLDFLDIVFFRYFTLNFCI